ncbi:hypothetical protein EI555_010557, partial [Monodon monoceros]
GECSPKCRNLFVLETVCVAWFSFEFLLRSLQAESKCAFLRTPLNIIDILAILPFYVSLLVGLAAQPGAGGNKLLERAGLVLRLLRALRVLYVMRLARHSLGLRSLGLTVRRCAREFGLLLLFLCVAMALFAPLVHLAERELGARRDFSSVPASYWWAVISMTTVGYGDMVPRSLPGQVVALSSILSGILLMAFPVTSIFHTFSRSYSELKQQQQRAASPEPALREDSTHSASACASAAEDDGSQGPDGAGPAGDSAAGLDGDDFGGPAPFAVHVARPAQPRTWPGADPGLNRGPEESMLITSLARHPARLVVREEPLPPAGRGGLADFPSKGSVSGGVTQGSCPLSSLRPPPPRCSGSEGTQAPCKTRGHLGSRDGVPVGHPAGNRGCVGRGGAHPLPTTRAERQQLACLFRLPTATPSLRLRSGRLRWLWPRLPIWVGGRELARSLPACSLMHAKETQTGGTPVRLLQDVDAHCPRGPEGTAPVSQGPQLSPKEETLAQPFPGVP